MNDIAIFEHHEFGRVRTLIEDGGGVVRWKRRGICVGV